jgi:hypothetical protein
MVTDLEFRAIGENDSHLETEYSFLKERIELQPPRLSCGDSTMEEE